MSADAARRTALAAQGFAQPRPTGRIDRRHLRRVFDQIGVVQIDSVNVLVRSHELPLFARLGPYPRTLIPDAVAAGELFEYWAHMASILPTAHLPLWRWRMERHRSGEVAWALPTQQAPRPRRGARPGARPRPADRRRHRGPRPQQGVVVGLGRQQGGARGAVRRRRHRRHPASERLRPPLRPPRAHRPRRLSSPSRRRTRPTARRQLLLLAARSLGVGTVDRSRRLLPTQADDVQAGRRRPRRRRPAGAGGGRRLAPPRRAPSRCRRTEARRGPGPAQPVRLVGVVPRTNRADVPLRVPHRDLHPGAEADLRLLRAPVPARRPARRAGRPEGRPRRRACCGCRRPGSRTTSTRRRSAATSPSTSGRSWQRWPGGSGWARSG